MDGMSNIVIFYFIAQVVERLLELIDWIISLFITKKEDEAKTEKKKNTKMIVMWFVAILIALAFVYWLDLMLMTRLNVRVESWIDKLLTALVIGSGTKPIHDMISLMNRKK
jgi:hypothetical protein